MINRNICPEDMDFIEWVQSIVAEVKFENYTFTVFIDREGALIQGTYPEEDIVTGQMETQYNPQVARLAVRCEVGDRQDDVQVLRDFD